MPSVNALGGVDPYVEIRSVSGEWSDTAGAKKLLMDKGKTHDSAKTMPKTSDFNPVWDENIVVKKAHYGKDKFINIILWDENAVGDTPIGWHQIKITDMIGRQQYDPTGSNVPVVEYHCPKFESLLMGADKELTCTLDFTYSFFEVHEFTITIQKAACLPKTDTADTIDSFIELRVVDASDPLTMEYEQEATSAAIKWSATSKTVKDNTDPTFEQAFTCTIAANPAWHLMLVLNHGSMSRKTPLGMATVPLRQICCNKMGAVQKFRSTFVRLSNWDAPKYLDLSSLEWSIKHELAPYEK